MKLKYINSFSRKLRAVFLHILGESLKDMTRLTTSKHQPNINDLWWLLKDVDVLRLNVKNFGYQISRQLAQDYHGSVNLDGEPQKHNLTSKPTTQRDIESSWFAYWCKQLHIAPIYHRKIWEFAFVLQALYEADMLKEGRRGLGFGCGEELLPSYFASRGINVTVTDLEPEKSKGLGWVETGQHTSSFDRVFYPDLVTRESFLEYVRLEYVDMNDIPKRLHGLYDFSWSICALEHLGSIELGFRFIENSMHCLKPGGVAVHTTEFNYLCDHETVDNWPTVLFLKKHFIDLKHRLEGHGYVVSELNFDTGDGVLDRFIDVPPYSFGQGWLNREIWGNVNQAGHLKLAIDGFPCTCFGLIIHKPEQVAEDRSG